MADANELRGIFCIETAGWFGDTDPMSMRPMLQWLHDVYDMPFLHRDASTKDELFRYLDIWGDMRAGSQGDNRQYPILILSYHGDASGIWLSGEGEDDHEDDVDDSSFVQLDEIADFLEGRCENKVIHFASCSTINVSNMEIGEFLEKTNASAVSGYSQEVEWTWSMAMDLLYLEMIQTVKFKYLNPTRMREVSDWLKDESWGDETYPYDALRKRLGFDIRERTKPA